MSAPETHDGRKVVITTPDYREGQRAAWKDYAKDPEMIPNRALLDRVSMEFAAGYLDEWENFIVPSRNR